MFAPQLVFQLLDSSFLCTFPAALIAAKGSCPVFEKLLLPFVKHFRLKSIFVTQV